MGCKQPTLPPNRGIWFPPAKIEPLKSPPTPPTPPTPKKEIIIHYYYDLPEKECCNDKDINK